MQPSKLVHEGKTVGDEDYCFDSNFTSNIYFNNEARLCGRSSVPETNLKPDHFWYYCDIQTNSNKKEERKLGSPGASSPFDLLA